MFWFSEWLFFARDEDKSPSLHMLIGHADYRKIGVKLLHAYIEPKKLIP